MKCYILKTIIVGDCGVGKTTLLYKYYNGNFNYENESTVGVNFVSKYIENKDFKDVIKLQVWDTAGQERFRSIIRSYYHNVCGCIVAYDITNRSTFDNCTYWIDEVRKNNTEAKLILVGTKKDLEHERSVDREEGVKLSNYYDIPFFEISSKEGVTHVFDKLVNLIVDRIDNDELNVGCMKGIIHFENFETYKYRNNNNGTYLNKLLDNASYVRCCNN